MRKSTSDYPEDWPEIAKQVKEAAGWKCVRCGHIHEPKTGYSLTVHHMDLNPSNSAWWNIPALCQRCHLHIQGRVIMERPWLFAHSTWFKPYVAGYYAHQQGLPEDKDYVVAHLDELLAVKGLTG
jgi:5-methylcytosine-specific restriction endonuclease McrA